MRRHDAAHHVAARFPSDDDALDAVHDLQALPAADHVRVEFHRAADHEVSTAEGHLLSRVVTGMVAGIPAGITLGLMIMLAVDRWLEPVEGGFVLGVGIPAGAIFGILTGGLFGLAWGSGELETARAIDCLHLDEQEEVVIAELDTVALKQDTPAQVREVFAAHHGELLHL